MKEKKGRLYKFYGKLTIRNKLLISCLPFVILGYFLIFYSTTVIMFDQMKQMVYDQTEQNVMEKKKLVKIQYSLKCRLIYIILNKVNLKDNFDN